MDVHYIIWMLPLSLGVPDARNVGVFHSSICLFNLTHTTTHSSTRTQSVYRPSYGEHRSVHLAQIEITNKYDPTRVYCSIKCLSFVLCLSVCVFVCMSRCICVYDARKYVFSVVFFVVVTLKSVNSLCDAHNSIEFKWRSVSPTDFHFSRSWIASGIVFLCLYYYSCP